MDLKLEVVVIPVADVDRAKAFHLGLGWRLDADFSSGPTFRVVQVTPPGSACTVKYEEQTGRSDPDWPTWYAQYMVNEPDRQTASS